MEDPAAASRSRDHPRHSGLPHRTGHPTRDHFSVGSPASCRRGLRVRRPARADPKHHFPARRHGHDPLGVRPVPAGGRVLLLPPRAARRARHRHRPEPRPHPHAHSRLIGLSAPWRGARSYLNTRGRTVLHTVVPNTAQSYVRGPLRYDRANPGTTARGSQHEASLLTARPVQICHKGLVLYHAARCRSLELRGSLAPSTMQEPPLWQIWTPTRTPAAAPRQEAADSPDTRRITNAGPPGSASATRHRPAPAMRSRPGRTPSSRNVRCPALCLMTSGSRLLPAPEVLRQHETPRPHQLTGTGAPSRYPEADWTPTIARSRNSGIDPAPA